MKNLILEDMKVLREILSRYNISESVIIIDAMFVSKSIDKIKPDLVNQNLGNLEIEELLNTVLINKKIRFKRNEYIRTNDPNYQPVYLNGGALMLDLWIEIYYGDEFYRIFDEKYEYEDLLWDTFLESVHDIVEHELVHKGQLERIKRHAKVYALDSVIQKMINIADVGSISDYLGSKQEMMAFAKEAVSQFLHKGYTKGQILNRLKSPYSKSVVPVDAESDVFFTYIDFYESGSKEIQTFLKYMYGYAKSIK